MSDLPILALVYDPWSLTPWELIEASDSLAHLLWILDAADPRLSELLPLLRRRGTVLDTGGRSEAEIVDEVERLRPRGVMAFAERQMPLGAAIAERCRLRFHSPATAALLHNKHRQRVALARAGVPGPRFWAVPDGADEEAIDRFASLLAYPVVLKPQESAGSCETTLIADPEELRRACAGLDGGPGGMLAEELLVESRPRHQQRLGETLMVDSMIVDGRAEHYIVSGHFIPAPPFRGAGTFLPCGLDRATTDAVIEATDAALAALAVEQGFTNTDLILTPDGPRVLEVNGRIGGEINRLLDLVGASGLIGTAMAAALGAPVQIPRPAPGRLAFCDYLQPPLDATRLLTLTGVEAVEALPGVARVLRHRHPGDAVDWRAGTAGRVLTVYGTAASREELHRLHTRIHGALAPTYETAHAAV